MMILAIIMGALVLTLMYAAVLVASDNDKKWKR